MKSRKRKVTPGAILTQYGRDLVSLTSAVHALAKRIVRLEKLEKARVIHGFADAQSGTEVDSAQELEDIDDFESFICKRGTIGFGR